ncbi:MAG: sigma-70 family RNA polymerase sigma factor [Anaerolineae bacterium]|nr:sigma-70 family RNA polymerase sigma factor [Anaerolineae bacterium]
MADESSLVIRLKQRDREALAEVFELYSDSIYQLALSLLHDEQVADEVVQNTFMALIEHIDTFEGRSSIGTWLYRVAYNEGMGRLRRVRPQVELDDSDDEQNIVPGKMIDWQTLPDALLSSLELQHEIQRAVQTLKPVLRAVFVLRDVEELSTDETAHVLGITPGAVKVRLHRARLALREQLSGYFVGL